MAKDWATDQKGFLEWRKGELDDVKAAAQLLGSSYSELSSRMAILFCYAHWEGAFADNSSLICQALRYKDKRLREVHAGFAIGFIDSELNRLRDRNHSEAARIDFAEGLGCIFDNNFEEFNDRAITPRSNLDTARVKTWCRVLGRSPIFLERKRIFIDHQLVRLRHDIAHGGAPRLIKSQIDGLVDQTVEVIDDLCDFVIEYVEQL